MSCGYHPFYYSLVWERMRREDASLSLKFHIRWWWSEMFNNGHSSIHRTNLTAIVFLLSLFASFIFRLFYYILKFSYTSRKKGENLILNAIIFCGKWYLITLSSKSFSRLTRYCTFNMGFTWQNHSLMRRFRGNGDSNWQLGKHHLIW